MDLGNIHLPTPPEGEATITQKKSVGYITSK